MEVTTDNNTGVNFMKAKYTTLTSKKEPTLPSLNSVTKNKAIIANKFL
jgi:hypothetical protein